MELELKGKNAIISGSSRWIGLAIAIALHKEGCNVIINGRNKKNIVGLNFQPQFPKKPDIIIENKFDKNLVDLNLELQNKIYRLLKKKRYEKWLFGSKEKFF